MKFCSKCGISKNLSSFYQRKRGPRAGEYYEKCKDCMKLRGKSYYYSNRDRQLALALIRRKRNYVTARAIIDKLKNKPCVDCKKSYPSYVMDFDHVEGDNKITDVSKMIGNNSIARIMKEIAKCDIVCANCHRERTHKQNMLR